MNKDIADSIGETFRIQLDTEQDEDYGTVIRIEIEKYIKGVFIDSVWTYEYLEDFGISDFVNAQGFIVLNPSQMYSNLKMYAAQDSWKPNYKKANK